MSRQAKHRIEFEQVRDCELARRLRIGRIAHTGAFEVIDDVDGILHDATIGKLHDRDDAPPDSRHHYLREMGVAGRSLTVADALLAQVTANLAGIERVRQAIEDKNICHQVG